MTNKFNKLRVRRVAARTRNLPLVKNSQVVPFAPKVCEVLLAFVEINGQIVKKEETLENAWADTFVEEANLTHHISALRKALGEDENGRKFIETIPRRGYRFVAEVKSAASSENAEIIETSDGATEITVSKLVMTRFAENIEIETDISSETDKFGEPKINKVPFAAPPEPGVARQ